MSRINICCLLLLFGVRLMAQGPYAPAAGQPGSTAIHEDSSIFVAWASNCVVQRGKQDISDPMSPLASVGQDSMATHKANYYAVVSLGDGGQATLTFPTPIVDGPGFDFAVFENSFSDTFLELAFVEVSSDGQNFYRFPTTTLLDTTQQIGPFDTINTTFIDGFAGKYRQGYGTPFDLSVLAGQAGLDVNQVTHVRVIDVVGNVSSAYATYDSQGNKVNDPFPTPFPSSGFDLDGVGVIHTTTTGIPTVSGQNIKVYPNPFQDQLQIELGANSRMLEVAIYGLDGRLWQRGNDKLGDLSSLPTGVYLLRLQTADGILQQKVIKR